jgi:hypothetical protein
MLESQRPIGWMPNKRYFLDWKLKPNPKYSHVRATMNTGPTVDMVKIIGIPNK